MPTLPTRLPLTDEDLRTFVEKELGLGPDDAPFWDEGVWCGAEALWPDWHVEPRFADWREEADARYEGLEDEAVAREALAAGRFPVALAGPADSAQELFKDGSGNVYLQVPGARTPEGTEPVFFFDHDRRDVLTVAARNLEELHARKALEQWAAKHGLRNEAAVLARAPVPLDLASLHAAAAGLHEGWSKALGAPEPKHAPPTPVAPPRRPRACGSTLGDLVDTELFQEAFNTKFILARSFDAAALPDLCRPFLWWTPPRFQDLEFAMRNCMGRMLALLGRSGPELRRWTREELDAGVKLLDAVVQRGEIALAPSHDPLEVLRCAAQAARGLLGDGGAKAVLPQVPAMQAFHQGWRGIVPDAELDRPDAASFEALAEICSRLIQTKNTVYNLVRSCGDEHVAAIAELLPKLVPADQLYFLHGLDAFPKHLEVIALYDQVLAQTPHEAVRARTVDYLERVRTGRKTTGWEP